MALFRRNARVEHAPFETEAILFNPDTKQFVKLNRTTSAIWSRLESGATVEDVARTICEQFQGVVIETATEDANAALSEMLQLGLVQMT